MATTEVHRLLGRVRSRLWRAQFIAAVRKAMWASAALMLLAVIVHLAALRVPIEAMLLLMSGPWIALMLRAGWRRPTAADCALWADRHLAGASAFTTVLELNSVTQGDASTPARRWLESWVEARVPECQGLLDERKEPMRLSRPLWCILVCAALATIVLTLPVTAPVSTQQAVAFPPSGIGDTPVSSAQPPASSGLVGEIANALRSTQSRDEPAPRDAGRAAPTERGKAAEGKDPSAAQTAMQPPGEGGRVTDSPSGTSVEPARAARGTEAAGAGSGRDAGDSRDERSGAGVSQAPQGTIAVTRSAARRASTPADLQADMNQPATYHDESPLADAATTYSGPEVAAATPPPVTVSTRLTPTEATYVQAWMKASARRQ